MWIVRAELCLSDACCPSSVTNFCIFEHAMDFNRVQNRVSQLVSANFDSFAQLHSAPVRSGQICGGHTGNHCTRWVLARGQLLDRNGCCFLRVENILDGGLGSAVRSLIAISDSPPFPVDYISISGLRSSGHHCW